MQELIIKHQLNYGKYGQKANKCTSAIRPGKGIADHSIRLASQDLQFLYRQSFILNFALILNSAFIGIVNTLRRLI